MNLNRPLAFLTPVIACGMLAFFPAAHGKDTDVYLKNETIARDSSPNILIILDNSGSMADNNVNVDPDYDPTKTYTGSYDSKYIYWSYTTALPASSSTDKFLASNNVCEKSKPMLGNTAGAVGYYSDRVIGWVWNVVSNKTSSTQGRWAKLEGGTNKDGNDKMADVECAADDPADSSGGKYLRVSVTPDLAYTNRYTDTLADSVDMSTQLYTRLYSGNYLNYKENPGASVTKTRMDAAKSAVKNIIDSTQGVRMGLMVFNQNDDGGPHGGRVISKIDNLDDTKKASLKSIVDGITGKTWTPLSETLYEAYLYLGGKTVKYGNPSPADTPAVDLCAQDASCATASGQYISPFTLNCQKAYIVLVTDGDPTKDSDANTDIGNLPGIGTLSGNRLDELAGWMNKNDVFDGTDGAGKKLDGKQTVITNTVGFGNGISATGETLLKNTASKGGGRYLTANNEDELSSAVSGAIIDAMQVTTSFVAPALSVNAFNTLFNRDDVYFAVFKPSSEKRWDGNIKKYKLCKDTSSTPACSYGEIVQKDGTTPAVDPTTLRIKDGASSFWSSGDGNNVDQGGAGGQLPAASSRNVYTYTGTFKVDGRTPSGGAKVDLSGATHAVKDSNTSLTAAMVGASTAAERTKIINWIRGVDTYDEDNDTNVTEDRTWRFYDPIHSRPVVVNYGGTSTDPIMKLFVGTNDGALHLINEYNGKEEWAFVLPDFLLMQKDLAANGYGDHMWGVDLTISVDVLDQSKPGSTVIDVPDGIIDPSIGDYVRVFVGTRRGGRIIYALDVTPSSKVSSASSTTDIKPKLLWAIRGGVTTGYDALGETWSRPLVRSIRLGTGKGSGADAESATTRVLMFGGGYDDINDYQIPAPGTTRGNAIFITDPSTGERIWWASGAGSGADLELSGMNYAIPSDLAPMDANGDGSIDRIYVGDLGGQIWRIDLSPTMSTGKNSASNGYIFADLACTSGSRPLCTGTAIEDRRRLFYPPNIAQVNDSIYGDPSNPKYDIVTIATGDREDPLDLLPKGLSTPKGAIHNRIYALRDYKIDVLATGATFTYPATIKETDLYNATSNALQSADTKTIEASGIQSSMGWYVDLKDSSGWVGEKSLARTTIFGGTLYATTYTPASDETASKTCAASEGLGALYAFNILNGAAAFDLNGSGGLDTSDRRTDVGGGIPSEHVVVIRPDGNSDLVGSAQPGAVNQALQRYKTYWFQ